MIRTAAVDNPDTCSLSKAFGWRLTSRGIAVTGGAWDIDATGDATTDHRSPHDRGLRLPAVVVAGRLRNQSQSEHVRPKRF